MKKHEGLITELIFWISLFSALLSITGIFAYSENSKVLALFILLLAVSAVFSVVTVRKLIKFGKAPLLLILRRISAKISSAAASAVRKIFGKREKRQREKTYLGGRDIHSFESKNDADKKSKQKELMRWSRLDNGRDKVRFLYRYVLLKKRKKGAVISPFETPLEQIGTLSMNEAEKHVVSAYTEVRWDCERDKISSAEATRLKSELNS